MELPFAVESSPEPVANSQLQQSESSSLVTASSQGSFMSSRQLDDLNTPQDVVLPRYDNVQQPGTQLLTPRNPDAKDVFGEAEVIDFTYVDLSDTDGDGIRILVDGTDLNFEEGAKRGDVLSVLLSGADPLVEETEAANEAALKALEAKKQGDLLAALRYHTEAAKMYKENAINNPSFAKTMLLLSQTQAKSALALKSIIKLSPTALLQALPTSDGTTEGMAKSLSHKDRLRAAVRGALGSKNHEADISDSQFLGRATPAPSQSKEDVEAKYNEDEGETVLPGGVDLGHNPVDEMMELERELRDMDMALELGNSISSLDTRMQNRMKNSVVDGSFMVVPPGSNSYMSSSMWGAGNATTSRPPAPQNNAGTAGVRARANRVQNILGASAASPTSRPAVRPQSGATTSGATTASGLESSWWGNASTTSQILTSSVISLGTRVDGGAGADGGQANTKQLMRLMDSLKTLGDENASLLREVEDAEAARMEATATREQMKRFKAEYGRRFAALKAALEKFRQDYSQEASSTGNPVNTSEFVRTASITDQVQRQEQLIKKLTADLKKEKEESKKKDAALRKYESFYREVKARSAQKAAQRQVESKRNQQTTRNPSSRTHR